MVVSEKHPVDLRRLEAAPDNDPLAVMALAIDARRSGRLGEADALYQRLLEIDPTNFAAANNAANVRLELGHMDLALDIYRRASAIRNSATVLFNQSQAHGEAFQMDDLSRTLAAAQQANGEVVAELTELQGSDPSGFTVDLPLGSRPLWNRILRSRSGDVFATELRSAIAPGLLGRDWRAVSAVIAALTLISVVGAVRLRTSISPTWTRTVLGMSAISALTPTAMGEGIRDFRRTRARTTPVPALTTSSIPKTSTSSLTHATTAGSTGTRTKRTATATVWVTPALT